MKCVLHKWNTTNRAKLNAVKRHHLDRVAAIDALVDQGLASKDDLVMHNESRKILSDLDRSEAKDLAQKAKVKWAVDGDENTKFFHGILKKKRRNKAIKGVLKYGSWIEEPTLVKGEFLNHFRKCFAPFEGPRPWLGVDLPKHLSSLHSESLEVPFSHEEIKRAVWECGGDRAPGPDGFTFAFFKHFWAIIEQDVIRFVEEFYVNAHIPKGCNPSFIALIPKVSDPKVVTDFRPISLIGCQYKIIGKLLANRISMVIGECVRSEQTAFIKGRNILDGPLILNEVMEWYRKRKRRLMIFKVDFEKAYDSLRWKFLDLVMAEMGFGFKWRRWIEGCLVNARASILVNGVPTDEFEICRGLRQGDPLSPFLFILVMEGLHAVIRKALLIGLFKGALIGQRGFRMSHLIYADDVVFMGDWSLQNANNLIGILRCFFVTSGLKINVQKSKLLGVGVDHAESSEMASILGCGVSTLPLTYLGVPVGCNMSRIDNWKGVLDKFKHKLSTWNSRTLSVGGRLALIKAVLGNLPTYYMSLYKVPVAVEKNLESMRNNFFVGGDSEDRKMTWVAWKKCMASKEYGGLGVGSIYALNRALLFKWI